MSSKDYKVVICPDKSVPKGTDFSCWERDHSVNLCVRNNDLLNMVACDAKKRSDCCLVVPQPESAAGCVELLISPLLDKVSSEVKFKSYL